MCKSKNSFWTSAMSAFPTVVRSTVAGMACLAATAAVAAQPTGIEATRCDTYKAPDGSTYFALSLPPIAAPASDARDMVILFDTSAGQAGTYREKAIEALETLLHTAGPNDRVQLFAVDLNAIALTKGFVAARGADIDGAMMQLRRRVPLGATDMGVALAKAAASFGGKSTAQRSIVYLGDGSSAANRTVGEYSDVVDRLVGEHVSVIGYAIGRQIDATLLAALANQTGGTLLVDSDQMTGKEGGQFLFRSAESAVVWPTATTLSKSIAEIYPKRTPPLRADRDTILVGKLADATGHEQIKLTGEIASGRAIDFVWNVEPKKADSENAYVAQLVDGARADGGQRLPTLGSQGLWEARRLVHLGAQDLARLGSQIAATGNKEPAKQVVSEALRRDPNNARALAIQDQLDGHVVRQVAAVDGENVGKAPLPEPPASSGDLRLIGPDAGQAPAPGSDQGNLLQQFADINKLRIQQLVVQVNHDLDVSRARVATDPASVKQQLRLVLDQVSTTPELPADTRAQLVGQIQAVLLQAASRQEVNDLIQVAARRREAEAKENQLVQEGIGRRQEKIKQLTERMNALLAEGRYAEAQDDAAAEIARTAPADNPDNVITASTHDNSLFLSYVALNTINRQTQEKEYLATMHLVDQSAIAFPDDQPIIYPPADVWRELTKAREKYRSVDLKEAGSAEAKIIKALDEPTEMDFVDTPLKDVVDSLKTRHGIEIQLDLKALSDAGVTPETTITRSLKGISLRSALRLMLAEKELAYIIDHEVLLITTAEVAKTKTVTKVYPVADLVLPINNSAGINPFQTGGGLGGQGGINSGQGMGQMGQGGFGGGGMGFGGGGGGFGGGGFGGGGAFDVPDTGAAALVVAEKPVAAQPAKAARIELATKDNDVEAAWNGYFARLPVPELDSKDPTVRQQASAQMRQQSAAVRETARQLMNQQKFGEVSALIRGALRNGWGQPWMYEVLALAMQADNQPPAEIERALMSAVAMARTNDDVMYVAAYLSRMGFNARALKLYRQVAAMDPSRFEPYMHGLELAVRLGDVDGIQWGCVGVLNQAWPADKADVVDLARRTALVTLQELRREKRTVQANRFESALEEAMIRDCVVRVTWNGDAEVDLTVEEPSGTVCSLRNPRTTSGGVLLAGGANRNSVTDEGTSEQYVVTQGFAGKYRMLLRRVWGKPTAGKVTVEVYTHFGSKKATLLRKQIPLGEEDSLVEFSLTDGRRHEALADAQLANAVQTMAGMNQAILAQAVGAPVAATGNSRVAAAAANANIGQQLAAINDPNAQQAFSASRSGNPLNNLPGGVNAAGFFPFAIQGAVGYQPVITTLPSGTNMSATAVISADRRYVRITATPLFSSIGPVQTFNFESGVQTQTQSGTGSGQLGGGPSSGGVF
jgi:hypothetical protein